MSPHKATSTALTVREAALLFNKHEKVLRDAIAAGVIPYRVEGGTLRLDADDVARWADAR